MITGAGGFFGLALVRAFANSGEQVTALDVLPRSGFQPRFDTAVDRVDYVTANVGDATTLTTTSLGKPAGIVHAAALTPTPQQMRDEPQELIHVNLIGTLNVLEFVRKHNVERLLFVSSAGVYDLSPDVVLREEDADGGLFVYGTAKFAAEIILWRYAEMYGFDAGAVRPTWLYGPAEEVRSTRPVVTPLRELVEAAQQNEPVRIEGHDARRDWLYVDEAAQAARRFYSSGMGSRALNLSSGDPRPFWEVVEAVQSLFSLTVNDAAKRIVDGSPDHPAVVSPDRAVRALGWQPPSLNRGLERYAQTLSA